MQNAVAKETRAVPITEYPDLDRGPRKIVIGMIATVGLFMVGLAIWMSLAELDISVTAQGQVVPSSRVQQIQSLEGGIIEAVLVREGQLVTKGELLVRLADVAYNSELGEVQEKYWSLLASIARLEAEASDTEPQFPREVEENAFPLIAKQRALWRSRRLAQDSMGETAQQQLRQRQRELEEARSNVLSQQRSQGIVQERMGIEEQLYRSGAGSRSDYLSTQQELSRINGELSAARITVSRLNAAVSEAQANLQQVKRSYLAEVNQELEQVRTEASSLNAIQTGRKDRVNRRELRAPKDGVVNRLFINTEGGVAQAGDIIMEIVPVEDNMVVRAKVNPKDIGFLQNGQAALLRVTAFDSSIYGALNGTVKRVGADAILEKNEDPYFEVLIETEENYKGGNGEPLNISPGMTVDTNIKTGKRTLLEYMLKPIVKTFDSALKER